MATGCTEILGLDGEPNLVPESRKITVTLEGDGGGRVLSSPPGIDCPDGACAASFVQGTSVHLSVTPNGGTAFGGWLGDCAGKLVCDVFADRDHAVGATLTDLSGGHNFVFLT